MQKDLPEPVRDVGVILAAAGSGHRYGKPKQFEMLGDLPIYQYVVRTFSLIPSVGAIVVVARPEDVSEFERGLRVLNPACACRVAAGGGTRQDSVAHGLRALREVGDISIVLVHDVARALVDDVVITGVIDATRVHGSAIAAIPVVDTLKRVVGGGIVETVSRNGLWRAQTPQGARMELLLAAFENAKTSGYQATDESELLERVGEQPRIVEGSEMNFKLTYAEDLERARRWLQELNRSRLLA